MILIFKHSTLATLALRISASAARTSNKKRTHVIAEMAADRPIHGREVVDAKTRRLAKSVLFPLDKGERRRVPSGSSGSKIRDFNPDVGILHGGKWRRLNPSNNITMSNFFGAVHDVGGRARRTLQTTTTTNTDDYVICGPMCKPSLCECFYSGDFAQEQPDTKCIAELDAVCEGIPDADGKEWTIQGCIPDYPLYPKYQDYIVTVYCPMAKCMVDGGTTGSCACQGYKTNCEKFGNERMYTVSHVSRREMRKALSIICIYL